MPRETKAHEGSRERRNAVANYAGKFWSGASNFLFVPLYIDAVGIEGYGIIAFQAVLLVLMYVIDGGLSTIFARFVATAKTPAEIAPMLASLERAYSSVMLGIVVVATIAVFAFGLADGLPADTLSPVSNASGLSLMILGAALQICMSVYSGLFFGSGRHVLANAFQVCFTATRSGLVLIPLYATGSLLVYFLWQMAATLVFLGLMRHVAWRTLGARFKLRRSQFVDSLWQIWPAASSVLMITAASALNQQLDRLVVTAVAGVAGLGTYSVAVLIGGLPVAVASPYAATIAPRLHRDAVAVASSAAAALFVRDSVRVAAIAGALTVLILAAPSHWYQMVNPQVDGTSRWGLVVSLLAAGNFALALQLVPYQLCIARLNLRANTITAVIAVALTGPLSYWAATLFGEKGVAATWLVTNTAMLAFMGWRVFVLLGTNTFRLWLERGALAPCICMGGAVALSLALPCVWGDWVAAEVDAAIGAAIYVAGMHWVLRRCAHPEPAQPNPRPAPE